MPSFVDPDSLALTMNAGFRTRFEMPAADLVKYSGPAVVLLTREGDTWVHQALGTPDGVNTMPAHATKGGVWAKKQGGQAVDTSSFATKTDLTNYPSKTDLLKRFEMTVPELGAYTGSAKVLITLNGDTWVHEDLGTPDGVDVIAAAPARGGVWSRKAGGGPPPDLSAYATKTELATRLEMTQAQMVAYTGPANTVIADGAIWVHTLDGAADGVNVLAAAAGKPGVWTRKGGGGGDGEVPPDVITETELNTTRPVYSAAVQGSVLAANTAAGLGATVDLTPKSGEQLTAGLVTDGYRHFKGGGLGAPLVAASSLPRTTDMLTITPPDTGNAQEQILLDGVSLHGRAGGRDALRMNLMNRRNIGRMLAMRSLFISDTEVGKQAGVTENGYALRVVNESNMPQYTPEGEMIRSTAIAFDTFFASTFLTCRFEGGIKITKGGDSISFIGCTMNGPKEIDITLLSRVADGGDSSQLLFLGNNVTPDAGTRLGVMKRPRWVYNNCELVPPGSRAYSKPLLHFQGTAATLTDQGVVHTEEVGGGTIAGNYLAGPSTQPLVKLEYTDFTWVYNNTLEQGTGESYCLHITATARNTVLGSNMFQCTPGYEVLDEGKGTMGLLKRVEPTMFFSGVGWSYAALGTRDLWFIKQPTYRHAGLVSLMGSLGGGPTADGTHVFQLPEGFRPASTQIITVMADTVKSGVGGKVLQPIRLILNTNGWVVVFGSYPNADSVAEFFFGGVTFMAPYV